MKQDGVHVENEDEGGVDEHAQTHEGDGCYGDLIHVGDADATLRK